MITRAFDRDSRQFLTIGHAYLSDGKSSCIYIEDESGDPVLVRYTQDENESADALQALISRNVKALFNLMKGSL